MKTFITKSGPYKNRIVILKRKDVMNNMWYVTDIKTKDLLFVHEDELIKYKIKRYKLKVKP